MVLLHGFTQSGASWDRPATALAGDHELAAVDLPGHGRSAHADADLWEAADLVAEAAGPGTYVGYSMGARVALHVALAHPEVVTGLVLVSSTAGLDTAAERTERRRFDEQIARRIEADGVAEFVRWWLERPLFSTLPAEAAAVDTRLDASAVGLASSLRRCGTGSQQPLWGRLGDVTVPALVVAGELDGAYTRRARRLAGALGGPTSLEIVAGAGHACHLERPDAFSARLGDWLAVTA